MPISGFLSGENDENYTQVKAAFKNLRNKTFEYENKGLWNLIGVIEKPNFNIAGVAKLFLDEKEYEVAYFDIFFSQDVDHKGKPQHEVGGGLFKFVLKDTISNSIYDWAKRSTMKKKWKNYI